MELSLRTFKKLSGIWIWALFFYSSHCLSFEKKSEIYFNHTDSNTYQEPYRKLVRNGDNLEEVLLKHIESAQKTIDIAVQELRLPILTKALIKKKQAGVRVRIILENTYHHSIKEWVDQSKEGVEFPEAYGTTRMLDYVELIDIDKNKILTHEELLENDAIYMLRHHKIPLVDDTADGTSGSALMHHKFMVIDGQTTIVTSANFTLSDIHGKILEPQTRGNANALLVFYKPEIAPIFLEEFNIMFGDSTSQTAESKSRFGLKKPYRGVQTVALNKNQKIEIQFSPTSQKRDLRETTAGLINKTLSTAQKSIDMALFVFSDQYISDHLHELKKKKNLEISAMIDPVFAFRYYSEALDMLGLSWRAPNCRFTPGNNPWKESLQKIGAPQMDASDKLHHKFAVIDDQKVIFGSKNWTEAGNFQNNETLMVIEDSDIVQAFKREIHRWQNRTKWGVPSYLEERANQHESDCRSRGEMQAQEDFLER